MKRLNRYSMICMLSLLAVTAGCDAYGPDNSGFTPDTPQLSIQVDAVVNVPRDETRITIPVTSNLPWRASANVAWITFETGKGAKSGDCVAVVALNEARTERTGTVRVYITDDVTQSFNVVQAPTVPGDDAIDYYVKATGDAAADGLSWANATTLQKAFSKAIIGDNIHVAAGTYVPWATVKGGVEGNAYDKGFSLTSNVRIIGGYPADAQEGDLYNPAANETVFSGVMDDGTASHVVVVTADHDPDITLTLKGITITGGNASASGNFSINGNSVNRNLGGGVVISGAAVDFVDCTIKNNSAAANGNIYAIGGSAVSFENCLISGNLSNSNCAALFNNGSTVSVNNCTFDSNLAVGVGGAVYAFNSTQKSYTYIYNSTFTGNMVNSGNTHPTRAGAGVYARENSEVVIVNCTFSGNRGGNGGAISAHGSSAAPCKVDIINCTISGNTAQTSGGGVHINNSHATVRMYNTIVSGNTAAVAADNDFALLDSSAFAEKSGNVEGSNVYDPDNSLVSGSFDASAMLSPLAANGGPTRTMALTGGANPALTSGWTVSNLTALGLGYTPPIPADVIARDQRGVSREGKAVIGAWVND